MSLLLIQNRNICLRWFILIGVLSGLFFSSSEGIRLMPFPDAAVHAEEKSSYLGQEQNNYNFSVSRFGTHSFESKPLFQKHLSRYPAGNVPNRFNFTVTGKIYFLNFSAFDQDGTFYSSVLLNSPSDRGPPKV